MIYDVWVSHFHSNVLPPTDHIIGLEMYAYLTQLTQLTQLIPSANTYHQVCGRYVRIIREICRVYIVCRFFHRNAHLASIHVFDFKFGKQNYYNTILSRP